MLDTPIADQTSPLSQTLNHKAGWVLFAACILGIMIQIDYSAVNVALVDIANTVKINLSTAQWILSAYVLAWGSFVLAAGRLADLFGKRRIFLIGTLLFMLGSGLTGAASHALWLVLGRVIQGIGGALFLPGLYTLVFTAYPEHKRGMAFGVLTAAIAIGLAIGPTFGGVVVHVLNWRWIFFLNIPLGIPVVAIVLWAIKREPWRTSQESMDYIGAALLAFILLTFMFALNHISNWGIISTPFFATMLILSALIFIFIIFERRQAYPLIGIELFSNRAFLGCSFTFIFLGYNFATTLIIANLYLQNALGYSALTAGLIFLIMTVMFGILSIHGGKMVDRMDPRIPIAGGATATLISMLIFATCTTHSPLWQPILALVTVGIGIGLGFPALNTTMMKTVDSSLLNTASGAFSMFGLIGNTIGLIFSSLLIVLLGQQKLTELLANQNFTTQQLNTLRTIINSTHYDPAQLVNFPTSSIPLLMDSLRKAFIHAMSISMLLAAALSLLSIILTLVFIKLKK